VKELTKGNNILDLVFVGDESTVQSVNIVNKCDHNMVCVDLSSSEDYLFKKEDFSLLER